MQRLNKTVDMTEGPFLKKMIVFAVPLILTGFLQSLYSAADLVVVGRFKGDIAVAAVGSTGSLTNLVLGLFMGLAVGSGVCVAHHIGAKEYDKLKKVVSSSILLSAILGVVIAVVGFVFAEYFLKLMDTPDTVLPYSTLYIRIIFIGAPGSMLYNYLASMMRSAGDSKHPMIFLSISGVVNVMLNLILVALFGFGVEGVAIATITSQYLSAAMAFIYLCKADTVLQIKVRQLRMYSIKKILYIGIPSGIQGSLFSLSNVMIQSSINSLGDPVMAASSASANIEGFIYICMNAIYHVALTFIGQNIGAKKYNNIRRLTGYSILIVVVIGLLTGGLAIIFRYPLIGLYGVTPENTELAMQRLLIIAPTYFMCGMMEVFCGGLRALDRSVTAMLISFIGSCAFRIVWVKTVFILFPYAQIIYISYPISWFVTALSHFILMVITTRKLIKKSGEVSILLPPPEKISA